MKVQMHELPAFSAGTRRSLRSLHFGKVGHGPKAYLQASLHSDEVPPMLVAQHLIPLLQAEEERQGLLGEVVLVPMANPIGLAQDLQGSAQGRFDLSTGINFNRGYRHLTAELLALLEHRLGADAAANTRLIRAASLELLSRYQPKTETEALKVLLQTLAADADLVLDLHCDHQATMHLYTGTPVAEAVQPLATLLGARALLLARDSGDHPFDETVSRIWWELAEHFAGRFPIELACVAATVELRGEVDVSHDHAQADAQALMRFLRLRGVISGGPAGDSAPEDAGSLGQRSRCAATPLEGVEPLEAPHSGILVFAKELGSAVQSGEMVAEIIDPASDLRTPVCAKVSGVLFARVSRRFVSRGMRLAKVAGSVPFRSGKLLSL
jgi:predicted deacylase